MVTYPFQEDDSQDVELFPHTPGHFCPDMSCPDKEDQNAIGQVAEWVTDGLMSVDDANRFYRGQTL